MGKTYPITIGNQDIRPPTTRCICADCGMTQYSPGEGIWYVRIMTKRGLQWARRPTPDPACPVCFKRFEKIVDPRDDIEVSTPKVISIPFLSKGE